MGTPLVPWETLLRKHRRSRMVTNEEACARGWLGVLEVGFWESRVRKTVQASSLSRAKHSRAMAALGWVHLTV